MLRLSLLLAEGGAYRSSTSDVPQHLLMAAAVAVVALAIAVFYLWSSRRKSVGEATDVTPEDLLIELSDSHDLSRAERQLIVQLARTYNVPQPAALFVDPWTLEQAASAADADAPRYRALRQKLFGSLPAIGNHS